MQTFFRALSLALALTLAIAASAAAQAKAPAPQAASAPADAGSKKNDDTRKTPVAIEHDDNDAVGTRLAYRLKELLGHTRKEVFAGMLVGIAVAFLVVHLWPAA